MLNKKIASYALGLSLALSAPLGLAQTKAAAPEYPAQTIRFMVGFAPGAAADLFVRIISTALSSRFSQPIIADNRAGAGGVIGLDALAKSAPDGYTWGLGVAGALTAAPTLMSNYPFDPAKDVVPVSMLVQNPVVLSVNPALGVSTLEEFLALAKEKPGEITYGSAGVGTGMHLAGEMLSRLAGVELRHVPYRGGTPALTDLLAGHISAVFSSLAGVAPHLEAGRLKPLAITSDKRTQLAPEIPTIAESGFPGFDVSSWMALFVPKGTPDSVVTKIQTEVVDVMKDEKIQKQLHDLGFEPLIEAPEQLSARITRETAAYKKLIEAANISLN